MDQIDTNADPTESYGQDFNSVGEWLGARYRLRGVKALRETLAGIVASGRWYREILWEPAAELMLQGMSKPATMVRDVSLKCASVTDIDKFWPYSGEPTPTDIAAAKASAERQAARHRRKASCCCARLD